MGELNLTIGAQGQDDLWSRGMHFITWPVAACLLSSDDHARHSYSGSMRLVGTFFTRYSKLSLRQLHHPTIDPGVLVQPSEYLAVPH